MRIRALCFAAGQYPTEDYAWRALHALLSQKLADLLSGDRFAEMVALHLIAIVLAEEFHLLRGLDPFRDNPHIERLAQRYDGARDGLIILVSRNVLDKGLVDLEPADWESF